jgi:hypothetical protein
LLFGKSYKETLSKKSGMIPHRSHYIPPYKSFLLFQKTSQKES